MVTSRPRIVELGAGTGLVSRYISAMNPVLVERNGEWAALLRKRFPTSRFVQSARRSRSPSSSKPVGVVSSIPMLNNPQADAIRQVADTQIP